MMVRATAFSCPGRVGEVTGKPVHASILADVEAFNERSLSWGRGAPFRCIGCHTVLGRLVCRHADVI